MYSCLSMTTVTLPLSAGTIAIESSYFNYFRVVYSSFVRLDPFGMLLIDAATRYLRVSFSFSGTSFKSFIPSSTVATKVRTSF